MVRSVLSPNVWYKDWRSWKLRGRVGTIQTTELMRSARIPRRVLETCSSEEETREDSGSSEDLGRRLQWRLGETQAPVKNYQLTLV